MTCCLPLMSGSSMCHRGGEVLPAVMCLGDVQYINIEFHDRVSQDVHLAAEATLVKGVVSVYSDEL